MEYSSFGGFVKTFMQKVFLWAFGLILPIFQKSQALQVMTLEGLKKFTEVQAGPVSLRNNSSYISHRYKTFLRDLVFGRIIPSNISLGKTAVVTAVFGDDERDLAQYNLNTAFDYFYVSDSPRKISPAWQHLIVEIPPNWAASSRKKARWVKTSIFELLPEYEFLIWVDSNIAIIKDLNPLIHRLVNTKSNLLLFPHAQRSNLTQEAEAVIELGKAEEKSVREQLQKYSSILREEHVLWETPVIVASNNDVTHRLFKLWRSELESFTLRDQLSLPIALENSGALVGSMGRQGENIRSNPWFLSVPHRMDDFLGRNFSYHDLLGDNHSSSHDLNDDLASISVIIPVFRSILFVEQLLDSFLDEDFGAGSSDEIILVDDGSGHYTQNRLEKLVSAIPNARLISNHVNSGFAASVNFGVRNASNELCLILNSDTLMPGNLLQNLRHAWRGQENPDIVGFLSNNAGYQSITDSESSASWKMFGERGIKTSSAALEKLFGPGHMIGWPQIHGSVFAVRKSLFLELDGFDAKRFPFGYGEEVDFCLRAQTLGARSFLCLSSAYWHFGSASFTKERRSKLSKAGQLEIKKTHGSRLEHLSRSLRSRDEVRRLVPLFDL